VFWLIVVEDVVVGEEVRYQRWLFIDCPTLGIMTRFRGRGQERLASFEFDAMKRWRTIHRATPRAVRHSTGDPAFRSWPNVICPNRKEQEVSSVSRSSRKRNFEALWNITIFQLGASLHISRLPTASFVPLATILITFQSWPAKLEHP